MLHCSLSHSRVQGTCMRSMFDTCRTIVKKKNNEPNTLIPFGHIITIIFGFFFPFAMVSAS
ncbi:hypothetical protein HanLR1_Chr00c3391g0878081 [Helianthus annuus]|nr:hypothetical protein HanLR1_Chr00c3391g0878081 [Helianthus annuus]